MLKIIILILSLTLIINYGLHTSIISNTEKVREQAIDYVNHYCDNRQNINQTQYQELNEMLNFNLSELS